MIIDSNFGNLCMKKGGSFQKKKVFIFFQLSMGGVDPRNPPAYATVYRILKKGLPLLSGVTRFILQEGQRGGKPCLRGGGGQQFNDIISSGVISGVARNFRRGREIISTFFSSVFFFLAEQN